MTEYGTIKLPREAYERHNERRQDLGLTWKAYIDGEAPEYTFSTEVQVDPDAVREIVREETREAIEEARRR